MRAICRSTTLLNSSTTARGGRSAINRARSARNRSPLLSTWYGRSHAGTEPRPTADSAAGTVSNDSPGAIASMIGESFGQRGRQIARGPNSRAPTLVFPEPDGPTITPTRQSWSSIGSSAASVKFAPLSQLNSDFTRAAR